MSEILHDHNKRRHELFDIGEAIVVTIHAQNRDGIWETVDRVSGTSHHVSSKDSTGRNRPMQGIILNDSSFKYVTKGEDIPSPAPRALPDEIFTVEGINFRVTVESATSRSDI